MLSELFVSENAAIYCDVLWGCRGYKLQPRAAAATSDAHA